MNVNRLPRQYRDAARLVRLRDYAWQRYRDGDSTRNGFAILCLNVWARIEIELHPDDYRRMAIIA